MAGSSNRDETYGKAETARRLDALLRGAFSGPPKTYEQSKVGKSKAKPKASPSKPKRKKPGR